MAIPGYIRKRLARLGKIKLGPPVRKNSNEHPEDLTYFRVPEEVAAVYGDQPTALDVRVPSADLEKFCPITLQRWNTQQKKLCGSSDSVTAHEWQDEAAGFVEIPCAYKDCEHYRSGACVEVGDLYVILPKVDIAGVYHIATKSINGLGYIYNEFSTFAEQFDKSTNGEGDITRVDFTLSRVPEITTPYVAKLGKRVSSSHAMLHLRTTDRLTDEKAKALGEYFSNTPRALGEGSDLPALPSGEDDYEGEEDDAVLEGEFEHDGSCPDDLVAGASPVGPSLGQKTAFAALLEQVDNLAERMIAAAPTTADAMSKRRANFESSLARSINKQASKFEDLEGETEAAEALKRAEAAVIYWQEECEAEEALGSQAQAAPEPEAEPEPETQAEPVHHGDPTAAAATQQVRKARDNGNLGF